MPKIAKEPVGRLAVLNAMSRKRARDGDEEYDRDLALDLMRTTVPPRPPPAGVSKGATEARARHMVVQTSLYMRLLHDALYDRHRLLLDPTRYTPEQNKMNNEYFGRIITELRRWDQIGTDNGINYLKGREDDDANARFHSQVMSAGEVDAADLDSVSDASLNHVINLISDEEDEGDTGSVSDEVDMSEYSELSEASSASEFKLD